MAEFKPVLTVAEHRQLDESDVLIGYMDGIEGLPHPGSGHSRSYHHGWRNGMTDGGLACPDHDHRALAAAFRALRPPDLLH